MPLESAASLEVGREARVVRAHGESASVVFLRASDRYDLRHHAPHTL